MKLKRFLNASMILAFLAMSQTALAQAFTVQGRVVDESGEPMIGVAVTNKDGNTLGVTDADGRYSIELNSPTKLKFTFVGSETITIDAKKATQKDIVMRQTATALDDVVVVGYGTQKKINLTGAVQSINSKDSEPTSPTALLPSRASCRDLQQCRAPDSLATTKPL